MPDSGLLFLSFVSMLVGVLLFLQPATLLKLSDLMNRTLGLLDARLIRHRYIAGVLAFVAGYGLFKLALLLPLVRAE